MAAFAFIKKDLRQKLSAYLGAFAVALSAAIIIVCGQLLGGRVPAFETSLFRFTFQSLCMGILLLIFRTNPLLPCEWKPIGVMILSVVFNLGAGVLFIVSAWFLPVTVVHATFETVVIILAGTVTMFRKKCSFYLPIAIVLCIAGCVLLSQPEFIFHNDNFMPYNIRNLSMKNCSIINSLCTDGNCTYLCPEYTQKDSMDVVYGFICCIGLGCCLWGYSQFNINYLVQYTTVTGIVFWIGVGCFVINLPVTFIVENPIPLVGAFDIGMVILLAASFTVNNYVMSYSVTVLPLSHVALVLPTALIYLFIFQKTFLKDIQPGPGNWLEVLGLAMVLVGAFMTPVCDIVKDKWQNKRLKASGGSDNSPLLGSGRSGSNMFKYGGLMDDNK